MALSGGPIILPETKTGSPTGGVAAADAGSSPLRHRALQAFYSNAPREFERMAVLTQLTTGGVGRALGRLRFPQLFLLTGAVFLIDLFVPDVLPLADEIFLALLTALLGSVRRKRGDSPDGPEGTSQAADAP